METKERRPASARSANGKKRPARSGRPVRKPKPEPKVQVVYTQPKPFSRNRFLLRLATVAAVVLALTLGMSIFFKVDKDAITVTGMEKYKPEQVIAAAGIQDGENLLTLSKAGISGRIITKLPYVDTVRVGIKLPDTVHIEISELDVVYAIAGTDESWWLMDAGGRLVESVSASTAKTYTQIVGVTLAAPQAGQQAVASEPDDLMTPESTGETQESTEETAAPVTVRGSEKLEVVISVLEYLEDNGILGDVTALDVTSINSILLSYGDRFSVQLGDRTQLSYKIGCMKAAVEKMEDHESGTLDVSFQLRPNEVIYTPAS